MESKIPRFELKNVIEIFLKCLSERLFQSPKLSFWKCSYDYFSIRDFFKGFKAQIAMLKPHLIELLSCEFSTVSFSNKWHDTASCPHQKILVASLKQHFILLKNKKKNEGDKIVFFFFFAKFSGCCSVSMQRKGLFIEIMERIIHASEPSPSFSPLGQNKHSLLEPSLHEIMEQK